MAFQLIRADLEAAGACHLDYFFDSTPNAQNGVIDYPNGWTDADSTRVATEKPIGLLWLARNKFIPITVPEAKAFVEAAHPGKSFRDLVVAQHNDQHGTTIGQPPPP